MYFFLSYLQIELLGYEPVIPGCRLPSDNTDQPDVSFLGQMVLGRQCQTHSRALLLLLRAVLIDLAWEGLEFS